MRTTQMLIKPMFAVVVYLVITPGAFAEIHKCKDTKGKTTYSSAPCPARATSLPVDKIINYEDSPQGRQNAAVLKAQGGERKEKPSIPIPAGGLHQISSTEFAWINNGRQLATVSNTGYGNWKVKRIDGFYIGLITARGDIEQRDSGLKVNDVQTLIEIQRALLPLLSK